MSKLAHILALSATTVPTGVGISDDRAVVAKALAGQVWVAPRPHLETDSAFVQPIPYIVIRKGDEVLAYGRAGAGGETRLHGKVSVGMGGHVDAQDAVFNADGVINLEETMIVGMTRELHEEIGLYLNDDQAREVANFTHIIQSLLSPVDAVHIGFVATLDFGQLAASGVDLSFEDAIGNAQWVAPDVLLRRHEEREIELESWSLMLLNKIANG